jgi:hypothetical protein
MGSFDEPTDEPDSPLTTPGPSVQLPVDSLAACDRETVRQAA